MRYLLTVVGLTAQMLMTGGPTMAETNLLRNADLAQVGEDGVPVGWELSVGNPRTAPQLQVVTRYGKRWAQFVMRDNGASMGCLSQRVELPAGTRAVRVRARVRCTGGARAVEHALVRVYWNAEPMRPSQTPWIYRHFPTWEVMDERNARLDVVLPVPIEWVNRLKFDLLARWSPGGTVCFSEASVQPCAAPPARKARLAVVQGHASGSIEDACAWAAAQVAEAARQGADLVVLGEAINFAGLNLAPLQACEPIPEGPMSRTLSRAAAEHGIYVVAGLYELDGDIAYNSAVLFGRRGELVGRFRKVHLPCPEVDWGFTPGRSFPVFETDIGRVGMMICYDHHFAESSRALALAGAEIICVPIWGDGRADDSAWPATARTHAIENGVFYVSAIYSQRDSNIIDPDGIVLAHADGQDGVYCAEVDLTPHAARLGFNEEGVNMPRSFKSVWRAERIPEAYRPIADW